MINADIFTRKQWAKKLTEEEFSLVSNYIAEYRNVKMRQSEMKQTYEPVNIPTANLVIMDDIVPSANKHSDMIHSLDTLQCVPQPCNPAKGVSNNKEHNMSSNIYTTAASFNSTVPTDQKQRDYTLGRLYELRTSKKKELEVKFGLRGDETPETFNEFIARLTSGKFTFPEDKKDKYIGTYGILDYIRWRDPSVKEDDVGFRTAADKLDEAYTTARDTVVLSAADASLKILEDFKSATFH